MTDQELSYEGWTQSNLGILTAEEQEMLRQGRVLVAGVGAEGGAGTICLARLGVTKFRLADVDDFDASNLNRQFGCYEDTVGMPKVEALTREIKRINPQAEVEIAYSGVTADNAEMLVEGIDCVLEGIDLFALDAARALGRAARAARLYMVAGVSLGFRSDLWVFGPEALGLEEFINLALERNLYPYVPRERDLPPSFPEPLLRQVLQGERSAPCIAPTVFLTGGRVGTEVACILTGRRRSVLAPEYTSVDLLEAEVKTRHFFDGVGDT